MRVLYHAVARFARVEADASAQHSFGKCSLVLQGFLITAARNSEDLDDGLPRHWPGGGERRLSHPKPWIVPTRSSASHAGVILVDRRRAGQVYRRLGASASYSGSFVKSAEQVRRVALLGQQQATSPGHGGKHVKGSKGLFLR